MLPKSKILLLLVFIALLVPDPVQAEWPTDPMVNNVVCSTLSTKYNMQSFSDEAGGAYISWYENRTDGYHGYVQHLDSNGNPTWAPDGLLVCIFASSQQFDCDATPDGDGGLIVVWRDIVSSSVDIYAQRFNTLGYAWNANGKSVCINAGEQRAPKVVADGSGTGGAFVTWTDQRIGDDIYAQRLNSAGSRMWGTAGVAVCTNAETQKGPLLAQDGSGGVIIVWNDDRESAIFAPTGQRLNSVGTPQWTLDGRALNGISFQRNQVIRQIISDGTGGAYFSLDEEISGTSDFRANVFRINGSGSHQWSSSGLAPISQALTSSRTALVPDGNGGLFTATLCEIPEDDLQIWAQHFNAAGNYLWTVSGIPVGGAFSYEYSLAATSDNAGGITVAWTDHRLGSASIYAQRLNASGTKLWNSSGAVVSQGASVFAEHLFTDESGGSIIVGQIVSGSGGVIAQRLGPYGYLADPRPTVTAVTDFPNDQGGQVTVAWNASYLDAPTYLKVTEYSVWMREPEDKATQLDEQACRALATANNWSPKTVTALAKAGWGYVNVVPALHETDYSTFGPTFADSTAAGIPYIEYRIVAHTADHWVTWQSEPLSGYSVDNLAPGAPLSLAGIVVEGEAQLTWEASGYLDEDLAHYVIYRGHPSGFPLDTQHEVATSPTPNYSGPTAPDAPYYRITAKDAHGNQSPGSNVLELVTATDTPLPINTFALHANHPNPFNPKTIISFDLPQDSPVSLTVFTLTGAKVATLINRTLQSGHHTATWQGRDEMNRNVAAGIYLYQLKAGNSHQTRPMVLIR